MRIPSGKTDQYIYFIAVDSVDRLTRKTALTSFTVYRSRNNGTATLYTTPTVSELSAANMPGVYALLVDEDTTVASGSDTEEYCVHITQASMAPVSRTIELFRRDTTTGKTLVVDGNSRADASVGAMAADTLTASALASDAANEIADALLDRSAGIETNRTPRQGLRLMLAALLGKASGLATTTAVYRDTNDSKDRITATVDADGNRSAVTLDAS